MNEHFLNNVEQSLNEIEHNITSNFDCKHCGLNFNNKAEHDRHSKTHENKNNSCACGKKYLNRNGLWYHKKKCTYVEPVDAQNTVISTSDPTKQNETTTPTIDADMLKAIMTVINQNQEFKEMIIEQQKQLFECAKAGKTVNNFNLNVYLNETCKNAINMLDYVNSLQLDLTDLEETGKLGYTNGMSRIFINGLKDMDVHMRPIHCSDLKREVLYIKENDVWEKDNENRDKIKKALRMIEKKNIMLIPVWIKAHPNCVISSNRENTPYLKMVMQSTGGENPAETADMAKIITNIAKAVVINK